MRETRPSSFQETSSATTESGTSAPVAARSPHFALTTKKTSSGPKSSSGLSREGAGAGVPESMSPMGELALLYLRHRVHPVTHHASHLEDRRPRTGLRVHATRREHRALLRPVVGGTGALPVVAPLRLRVLPGDARAAA